DVERRKTEVIVMDAMPLRGPGAIVAVIAEIIDTLAKTLRSRGAFRQLGPLGDDVVDRPVAKDAARCIRILDNKKKTPRACRRPAPAQRWRQIAALADIGLRNRLAIFEGWAFKCKRHVGAPACAP